MDPNISEIEQQNIAPSSRQQILQHLSSTLSSLPKVRVTFRFLHIFIQGGDKIQYFFQPTSKLLEVKHKIDSETKKNFIFYLRESFIPSLQSKVGDVAMCYGRKQADRWELTLTASQNPYQYG